MLQVSEYLVVCFTSSLTFSIAGVAKEIMTLSLAVYIYNEHLSYINLVSHTFRFETSRCLLPYFGGFSFAHCCLLLPFPIGQGLASSTSLMHFTQTSSITPRPSAQGGQHSCYDRKVAVWVSPVNGSIILTRENHSYPYFSYNLI